MGSIAVINKLSKCFNFNIFLYHVVCCTFYCDATGFFTAGWFCYQRCSLSFVVLCRTERVERATEQVRELRRQRRAEELAYDLAAVCSTAALESVQAKRATLTDLRCGEDLLALLATSSDPEELQSHMSLEQRDSLANYRDCRICDKLSEEFPPRQVS